MRRIAAASEILSGKIKIGRIIIFQIERRIGQRAASVGNAVPKGGGESAASSGRDNKTGGV